MRVFILMMLALITACSQSAQSVDSASIQSAVAVKSKTQATDLASLSAANDAKYVQTVAQLYVAKASDVQVEDTGKVVKLLADDNKGSRHQKFLVKVASGQTLLFAHNIDLAPRIDDIQAGDTIEFSGEYVYNPKGGVVHWTHHDPKGHHVDGWIKHNGKQYQ